MECCLSLENSGMRQKQKDLEHEEHEEATKDHNGDLIKATVEHIINSELHRRVLCDFFVFFVLQNFSQIG